jgi:excinuclease ABC subunit C
MLGMNSAFASETAGRKPRRSTISLVATPFHFDHHLAFDPTQAPDLLRQLPEADGILALFGHATPTGEPTQPFLTRTANLRRRAQRLLTPPPPREQALAPDGSPLPSKRLNLRDRVARIEWCVTGSEFESLLTLYHATAALFGLPVARHRLKLRTPFFLRFAIENAHPRAYVTNRLSAKNLAQTYGPFPSRAAAERYYDAALDLFKLRRCYEDLHVHPDHPGCAYGEMKMCLAPCNTSCTAAEYAAEAAAVEAFFHTHGESLLATVTRDRDAASDNMDFEHAAALHKQHDKVKAAAALADALVRPIPDLRAVILQPAAPPSDRPDDAAVVFLLDRGSLLGPDRLSALGVRAVKEQTSVGSSLFAQPLMLQAVPLTPEPGTASPPEVSDTTLSPEDRAAQTIASLAARSNPEAAPDLALLSDHLALLRRWYFRPEKQRKGELFLPNPDGTWPLRRILRGAARAVLGDPKPMQETDRDAAKATRTRLIHAGREGVERSVPVLDKTTLPSLNPDAAASTFRTRRSRKQPSSSPAEAATSADKLASS